MLLMIINKMYGIFCNFCVIIAFESVSNTKYSFQLHIVFLEAGFFSLPYFFRMWPGR